VNCTALSVLGGVHQDAWPENRDVFQGPLRLFKRLLGDRPPRTRTVCGGLVGQDRANAGPRERAVRAVHLEGHSSYANSVALNLDGRALATGSVKNSRWI
jgi:hypothetical protein